MDYSYSFLILLLPLLSFIIIGLAGMKMSHKVSGLIGTASVGRGLPDHRSLQLHMAAIRQAAF